MIRRSYRFIASLPLVLALRGSTVAEDADCDALYFNAQAPDYRAARTCYEAEGNWDMLAVLRLNGEGGPVDLDGAASAIEKMAPSSERETLRGFLEERRSTGAAPPRIDYCRDLARSTLATNFCLHLNDTRERAGMEEEMASLADALPESGRHYFRDALAAYRDFEKAEGARAYALNGEGTIRVAASFAAIQRARADFTAHARELFRDGRWTPRRADALAAAERALDRIQESTLRTTTESWEGSLKDGAFRDAWDFYRALLDHLRKADGEARRAWGSLRDRVAAAAEALHPGGTPGEAGRAAAARMTDDRIRALEEAERP